MKARIFFTLLVLSFVPVFKGISQSIEIEAIGGVAWSGKHRPGGDIPHFKYSHAYVGTGFNYQVLKHSFLTSGLYYDKAEYEPVSITNWSMPFQWSQRYGKKVQLQLGLGMYVARLGYQYHPYSYGYVGAGDPLVVTGESHATRFDFGVAGSASVYVPLNKVLAIKAGINQNWGLKNVSQDTTVRKQRTTALFLGLSIKLKK